MTAHPRPPRAVRRDPLFIGTFPAGVIYADRRNLRDGDYGKCAFLDYRTLTLRVEADCAADLRTRIERQAASLQAQRGEQFAISASRQTVVLGDLG